MELSLDYPIYVNNAAGITRIDLSYRTDFIDNYPGIAFNFSFPRGYPDGGI